MDILEVAEAVSVGAPYGLRYHTVGGWTEHMFRFCSDFLAWGSAARRSSVRLRWKKAH